ncbi:MAG: acyl carrier protein [Verrucomicrobiae bacterium]
MATNDAQSSRKTKLLELVSQDVLEVGPDFNSQSNLFDAGLDSMAIMQLLLLIEQNFGVRLPSAKLTQEHFSSIDDLERLMDSEAGG